MKQKLEHVFLAALLVCICITLSSCNSGFPRLKADESDLPDNEISKYIWQVYPNNPTNFKYIIEKKLNKNYSKENIKKLYPNWA
ncbi:MAG: hypothetical protein Q3971_01720 [Moraxella sp.]|nr:hypothetical protein [Moraxella sp.]